MKEVLVSKLAVFVVLAGFIFVCAAYWKLSYETNKTRSELNKLYEKVENEAELSFDTYLEWSYEKIPTAKLKNGYPVLIYGSRVPVPSLKGYEKWRNEEISNAKRFPGIHFENNSHRNLKWAD